MLTRLGLIVTQRCDLKCAHCLRGYPTQRQDFPLELLPHLLSEARPFGAKHVALTGGEPHLHPQFTEIVRTISQSGYTWHFVSNGQQTTPYLSLTESYRDSFTGVTLSIDGANAETHNAMRNSSHAFQRATAAAREYVGRGYKLRLSACLSRLNKDQAPDLLKLAVALGAEGVNFGGVIPTPWNTDLALDDAEKLALYEEIQELCQDSPIPIRNFTNLHSQGGVHFCNQLSLRKRRSAPQES
jgi:MoaA/NifB/PqqE/SkfB family radical SAM enzyme